MSKHEKHSDEMSPSQLIASGEAELFGMDSGQLDDTENLRAQAQLRIDTGKELLALEAA